MDLSKLEKALKQLEAALSPPPKNDRERDGAIQRFEYSFEATWKTAQKYLKVMGLDGPSPRNVIRKLAQIGYISNADLWIDFLEKRNLTTHTYNEDTAQKVFDSIESFLNEAQELLKKMKQNAVE